jgi:hypothetical protein
VAKFPKAILHVIRHHMLRLTAFSDNLLDIRVYTVTFFIDFRIGLVLPNVTRPLPGHGDVEKLYGGPTKGRIVRLAQW